jgi:hypothetical protein
MLLGLTASATASAADYTWTGASGVSDGWSAGGNWLGDTAPSPDSSIGTLTFGKRIAAINFSENDLLGLSVEHWAINDTHEYLISGEPVALGSGGLSITAETGGFPYTSLLPLTLTASQSWSIGGAVGAFEENGQQVFFEGLSGEHANLTINFDAAGQLPLLLFGTPLAPDTSDDELGNVTIDGTGSQAVELGDRLNAHDGHTLTLSGIHFYAGGGETGPLISEDSTVSIASLSLEQFGPSRLPVASASFADHSRVAFAITGSGTQPGHDYSQLVSSGPVNLTSAELELMGTCPTVIAGQVYTLVSTTGSLSGSFSNAPNGGTIGCGSTRYRVTYNTTGSPQTVTLTALGETEPEKEGGGEETTPGGGGDQNGGGSISTPAPSNPSPSSAPSSPMPKTKPLKCRKGFKKRKVKGKVRCVKVKRRKHQKA